MMTTMNAAGTVTPEHLLTMPDAVSYELVDGRLVERNAGMESSEIAARIAFVIGRFLRSRPLGRLFGPDASYRCFPDARDRIRKPDVSLIRMSRLPDGLAPRRGHCTIPPDLAVEVVSPGDEAYELDQKVNEYLASGVPFVWVVWPESQTVMVYRQASSPLGTISRLTTADTISGEDVLPGFSCSVKDFFE